jgi:hypothetical protein
MERSRKFALIAAFLAPIVVFAGFTIFTVTYKPPSYQITPVNSPVASTALTPDQQVDPLFQRDNIYYSVSAILLISALAAFVLGVIVNVILYTARLLKKSKKVSGNRRLAQTISLALLTFGITGMIVVLALQSIY